MTGNPTRERIEGERLAGSAGADRVLRRMLGQLPGDYLVRRDPAVEVPATRATDESWLREQIRLRGLIWGIDDEHVLGTLWWYSATNWLVMPTVTSWFVTGRALSARLDDVRLFHQPDSRIPGSRSVQLGPATLPQLGQQLRESLSPIVEVLAGVVGKGERRLWSFVTDAITGRILWAAEHTGRTDEVSDAATAIIAAVGDDLPIPRLTTIEPAVGAVRTYLRRGSCCLLYQVPDKEKCSNCPRQTPAARLRRLEVL